MTSDSQYPGAVPPEDSPGAFAWLGWYFRQRLGSILTVPLLILITWALVVSAAGTLIQGLAMLRASHAVFGFLGLVAVLLVGWAPILLPPALYFSLLRYLPGLWIQTDTSRRAKLSLTLLAVIAIPLLAHLVYQGIVLGIGWIADQDPCAAFQAGVTGSRPPPPDCG